MELLQKSQKESINAGGIIISSIIAIAGLAFSICTITFSAINGSKKIDQAKNRKPPTNINTNFTRSYRIENL